MATFKAEIQDKKKDGTYRVKIRVTHNRKIRRLATNMYVAEEDLTRGLKIKDQRVLEQCEDLIRKCRRFCNEWSNEIDSWGVDDLTDKLKAHLRGEDRFELDFIDYIRKKASGMNKGTGGVYFNTASALCRFLKRDTLDISKISAKFLREFESFLQQEPSQRGNNRKAALAITKPKGNWAVSMYLSCIRAVHNRAKEEFNDEDRGLIRIPYSPFRNYKIKPQPVTRKRALPVDLIEQIISLPYTGNKRRDLAKDCFLLSFGLIGMNSADMFYAGPAKNGVIVYERRKTSSRRSDRAEMRVRIEPEISYLMEKYRDRKGEHLFDFQRRYASHINFNCAINAGLKQVGAELGIEDLTFYAARHSWATIARSAAGGIDKATVHEALNHVDPGMKITDIYIDKDWTVIWNANKKVLSLFDWTGLELLYLI